MTVGDLRARMSGREHLQWQVYIGRKHQRQELEAARRRAAGRGRHAAY